MATYEGTHPVEVRGDDNLEQLLRDTTIQVVEILPHGLDESGTTVFTVIYRD